MAVVARVAVGTLEAIVERQQHHLGPRRPRGAPPARRRRPRRRRRRRARQREATSFCWRRPWWGARPGCCRCCGWCGRAARPASVGAGAARRRNGRRRRWRPAAAVAAGGGVYSACGDAAAGVASRRRGGGDGRESRRTDGGGGEDGLVVDQWISPAKKERVSAQSARSSVAISASGVSFGRTRVERVTPHDHNAQRPHQPRTERTLQHTGWLSWPDTLLRWRKKRRIAAATMR